MANETDALKAYRDRLINVVKQYTAYGTDMKAAISLIEYVNAEIIETDHDNELNRLMILRNELARAMEDSPNSKWDKLLLADMDRRIEAEKSAQQSGKHTCADCKYTSDNRRKFTRYRGDYFCMNCAIGDNAIGKRAKIYLDNPHTTRKQSV